MKTRVIISLMLIVISCNSYADYRKGVEAFKDRDLYLALKYWEDGAKNDEKRSLYELGILYLSGKHVDKDKPKSIDYLIRSSELGFGDATYALFTIYLANGANLADTISLLDKASKQGSKKAQWDYKFLEINLGGKRKLTEVLKEQNDIVSTSSLGFISNENFVENGESIFNTACFACHGTGAAGAPKIGDKWAWENRIEKGTKSLYLNALNGFTGETGVMPAKGGVVSLSDEDVKNAVLYMVSKIQ